MMIIKINCNKNNSKARIYSFIYLFHEFTYML